MLDSWLVLGRANVHCDPVQFLVEFGVVGSLCMAAVVAILAVGWLPGLRRSVLARWTGFGCLAVLLHSFIDLPFRCPAILLSWCTLLAAVPRLTRKRGDQQGALEDTSIVTTAHL